MKRHDALIPLSREHHAALILAKLLQKGAPAYKGLPIDLAGKAAYALQFYHQELVKHFLSEEKIIIGKIKGINDQLDRLSDEIFLEHKELKLLFEAIPISECLENHLDSIGYALEKHIRKEEREFFPLIQDSCNETALAEILQLLTD